VKHVQGLRQARSHLFPDAAQRGKNFVIMAGLTAA
jgi:hypothetical protein